MKEELIDLYRAVQGRRGDWKVGDQYICLSDGHVGRVQNYAQCVWMEHSADRYLYLPPVYSDDGRCLVGMIKGAVEMFCSDLGWWGVNCWTGEELHFSGYCKSLPEALLRAIAEQEGDHAE